MFSLTVFCSICWCSWTSSIYGSWVSCSCQLTCCTSSAWFELKLTLNFCAKSWKPARLAKTLRKMKRIWLLAFDIIWQLLSKEFCQPILVKIINFESLNSATKNIQKIFREHFWSKYFGIAMVTTISMLLLLNVIWTKQAFLVKLFMDFSQFDFQHHPFERTIGLLSLMGVTFQFGTICYYGQRLTSQSEELLNASYNCEWYNQSKRFKSMLIVLRYVCQRNLTLGVGKTKFSFGTFYEVIIVEAFFNNLKIISS